MSDLIKAVELKVAAYSDLSAEEARNLYAAYVSRGIQIESAHSEVQTLKQEVSHWKHECLMLGNGVAQVGALRDQILAQAAEIVELRGAIEHQLRNAEMGYPILAVNLRTALSTPPNALAGAIEGMRKNLIKIECECGGEEPDGSSPTCYRCEALAAYDAALKGAKG